MADPKAAEVIDLEEYRWQQLAKHPPVAFGEVSLDGDRVRLVTDVRLTADAAETMARELYRLAGMLREDGHG